MTLTNMIKEMRRKKWLTDGPTFEFLVIWEKFKYVLYNILRNSVFVRRDGNFDNSNITHVISAVHPPNIYRCQVSTYLWLRELLMCMVTNT